NYRDSFRELGQRRNVRNSIGRIEHISERRLLNCKGTLTGDWRHCKDWPVRIFYCRIGMVPPPGRGHAPAP
ncbi:MAG: hypothetical protein AAB270_04595, partial [Chloroflexota bacterium]